MKAEWKVPEKWDGCSIKKFVTELKYIMQISLYMSMIKLYVSGVKKPILFHHVFR